MTESEENISLKDRYESLKLLCSEQIMANEILKEEVDRLRKSFQEISRHRAFLLEKLISLQSKSNQISEQDNKRSCKTPAVQNHQNRNTSSQRNRMAAANRRPPTRPKTYHRDGVSLDESEGESESMHADFDNGWEDGFHHMGVPGYRRPQTKNVKRQPNLPPAHPPLFKRSRVVDDVAGPSSRGNFVEYSPPGPSQTSMSGARPSTPYEFTDNCADMSEEPPIIYSKGVGFSLNEMPRRPNPSILKNSLVSESVNGRPFPQKPPPFSGGFFGQRFH